jgi:hypothetical protein
VADSVIALTKGDPKTAIGNAVGFGVGKIVGKSLTVTKVYTQEFVERAAYFYDKASGAMTELAFKVFSSPGK